MSNLRQAANSGPKKTYQTDHPEDSRYWTRLIEVLQEIDSGIVGARLERVLDFFNDEWATRNQGLLKRLAVYTDEPSRPTLQDLLELAKFGEAGGPVEISSIANNLGITYRDALLRTIVLVSHDLGTRVGLVGKVSQNQMPPIQAIFAPEAVIRFVLGVIETDRVFDEIDIVRLTQFFEPEIKDGVPEYALRAMHQAFQAQDEYDSAPSHVPGTKWVPVPDLISEAATLLSEVEEPVPIGQLARELGVPSGVATLAVLAMVASGDYDIARGAPYYTKQYGGTSLLRVRNDMLIEDDVLADSLPVAEVEIGELPPDQAKAILQGDLGKAPKEFAKAAFAAAKEQAAAIMHSLPLPWEDFENPKVGPEEMMELAQTFEDRIHAAEEAMARIQALEDEMKVLRNTLGPKLDAIMASMGITPPDPQHEGPDGISKVDDVVLDIACWVSQFAEMHMPRRPNNERTREQGAKELADKIAKNFVDAGRADKEAYSALWKWGGGPSKL